MRFFGSMLVVGLALGAPQTVVAQDRPVHLQTSLQAPYQVMTADGLGGLVPSKIDCIFSALKKPYVISVAPRKRNRSLLKANKIDGFFLSIPDQELDELAVPSEPLALERWHFFWRHGSMMPELPIRHTVGTVRGSNESIWSKRQVWKTYDAIPSTASLVLSLKNKRIDYALADQNAFDLAAFDQATFEYVSAFARYVPLVAYFSRSFTEANPTFMAAFNRALRLCVKDTRRPLPKEQAKLLTGARKLILQYREDLRAQVKEMRAVDLSESEKQHQDVFWARAMHYDGKTKLMEQVLGNALSKRLRVIAENHPEMTEIFVMDRNGYTIGMNRPTSDYYQGDEAKVQALRSGQLAYHLSQLDYDHSTRRFQVQVSFPLNRAAGGEVDSYITIGFDADSALAASLAPQ